MSSLTFLNSPLLWGLSLAAVPIIIHLLFRRRFRRIEWAPMRYLKLTVQRNRRRFHLEQLLLLLMRIAMILLIFFAVARPVMNSQSLAAWLGASSRTSQILVLDDSLSMAFSDQGRTAFTKAQELAVRLVRGVASQDRLTLALASSARNPLLREVEVRQPDEVVKLVRDLRPSDTLVSWQSTFKALDELVAAGTFPLREITVITDLRRSGWENRLDEISARWSNERVRLRLVDVGSPATENVALLDLKQAERLALVGVPTRFEARIQNGTDSEIHGLEAQFIVDGRPSMVRLPAILARQTATVPLLATFDEPGTHHVSLKLPDDALSADNQRWAISQVQAAVDFLLVDGEPSGEPLAGEVDFLGLALSVGVGQAEAFNVEIVTDSEWAAMPERRPDLMVLANVATLTSAQADQLDRLVREGMGLMVFLGEQVDPDNFNQMLYRGGNGLLPAELETVVDEEHSGVVLGEVPESALAPLEVLDPAVLERIRVRKFYGLRMPPELPKHVRVLARWNNTTAAPAVLEKIYGAGRVLLWTVTADKLWSDWPTEPSYVMAVREASKAVARGGSGAAVVTAGEPLRRRLVLGHTAREAKVAVPDAKRPEAMVVEAGHQRGDGDVLSWADTRHSGLYRMSWRDSVTGPAEELYAANADGRETDLVRIKPEELRGLWGGLDVEILSASGEGAPLEGKELWRTLAVGLLGLSLVEAGFATWAGRQR